MILVSGWIMSLGINRYIVGCKLISVAILDMLASGINRYIVGCKFNHVWIKQ